VRTPANLPVGPDACPDHSRSMPTARPTSAAIARRDAATSSESGGDWSDASCSVTIQVASDYSVIPFTYIH
jgi:hypothetical protein